MKCKSINDRIVLRCDCTCGDIQRMRVCEHHYVPAGKMCFAESAQFMFAYN